MLLLRRLTVLVGALAAVRRYVREHPDKVNRFVDRTAGFVDKRTKGRYHQRVDRAASKVRSTAAKI